MGCVKLVDSLKLHTYAHGNHNTELKCERLIGYMFILNTSVWGHKRPSHLFLVQLQMMLHHVYNKPFATRWGSCNRAHN